MAKRMMTITLIVLGITMFLMVGYFLVLFIAPGFNLFGIMYVSHGTRVYSSGEVRILDEMQKIDDGTFTGSITLEVDEVPVYVKFTEESSYKVTYYENFSGLTKTDIDYPSMTFEKDKLGGAVIKINGFEKWVFKNSNTERYVILSIPISNVSGDHGALKTDLIINSKESDIYFSQELMDVDTRRPVFNTISITTNGDIEVGTKISATTYIYNTNNSIIIPESDESTITAINYDLTTKGKVIVKKPIQGYLDVETKLYDISLISCYNLTAVTEYGDIKCYNKDERITIDGFVDITTKAGNVTLGEIKGVAQSKITTSSGKIDVQKMIKGTVTTLRGSIRMDSTTDVSIKTNMGRVEVEEALSKINIETKRGNVLIGGKGVIVNNPTVYSRLGKIVVLSASKSVNIETIKGNIEFTNTDSEDIDIKAGGKLTAKGLTGKVKIDVGQNSNLTFTEITSDSTVINAGKKCKQLIINALKNSKGDTRYDIKGKLVTRLVDNDNGTGTFSTMEQSEQLVNKLDGNGPYLKVKAEKANIFIYFKLSESESV